MWFEEWWSDLLKRKDQRSTLWSSIIKSPREEHQSCLAVPSTHTNESGKLGPLRKNTIRKRDFWQPRNPVGEAPSSIVHQMWIESAIWDHSIAVSLPEPRLVYHSRVVPPPSNSDPCYLHPRMPHNEETIRQCLSTNLWAMRGPVGRKKTHLLHSSNAGSPRLYHEAFQSLQF